MITIKKQDYPSIIQNPSGESVQELLGIRAGGVHSHSLARIVIPPGNSADPHFHKHSEESYLILSGRAALHIDQIEFELHTGEAVLIEPMEVHQISNPGDKDLVFLAVCIPAWQPGDSFEADSPK